MAGDAARLLDDAAAAARSMGRDDLVARLVRARVALERPATYVVVCGEFKKGKSSLVNALLGARVCATDADVATAVPTYVRYGPTLTATALAEESPRSAPLRTLAPQDVEDTALGRTLDEPADDGGAGRTPVARSLEITVPRALLRDGLVLVDTPGISGGLASSHAGVALRALALADVLVFVGDAGAEYGAAELEFLAHAASLCPRVVPVLTKTDLYPQWRDVLAADIAHLERAGLEPAVVTVSSPLRTAGLRAGDRELVAESGYPVLVGRLMDAARATAGSGSAAAAAVVLGVLGQVHTELTAERRGLDAGSGTPAQQAAWQHARDQAAELRGLGARWQQLLFDGCADMAAEVELDLTVRVRALRREAAATIAELPPARLGADLGPWLQHRTNELLLDHQRAVREQAERVVAAVTEQFGASAWALRDGLDVADDAFTSAAPQVVLAHGPSASRLDLGLVALRGGSAGAMISHAAGLVLGLAVPVVLPVAVVLATALAGRSWTSARTAQLRALRAETERAVLGYLEEVDTVTRKDTRDVVRTLQRRVRDQLGARASELYATATRSADQLASAIATAGTDRVARAAELDERLAHLERLRHDARELLGPLVPARA